MSQASQVRIYDPAASVVFLKTNERFGGLSNMAPGFPLRVNGVPIRTSEALYQACRFPHMPDVQRKIIAEHSPMTAKMRSKPFRSESRPDWDAVRVRIMRWCLRVKLAQNWREFGRLLLATGDRPIVEQSRKDDFWGAKVSEDGTLVGMNVLGRLLMELREQLKSYEVDTLRLIEPLTIPEFLLFGQPIGSVQAPLNAHIPGAPPRRIPEIVAAPPPPSDPQPSLFEPPMLPETEPAVASPSTEDKKGRKVPTHFPRYRDSGLPWLGNIPEHWDVRRNGRLFAERVETDFGELPILEVSLRTGVRVRDMDNGARKQQMADRSKYKRAAKGDIAYNMMRMWQGAVGVAPADGLVSPAYVVARPFNGVDPRYYTYLFRTPAYMREVNKFSRGIVSDRNRLYWDEFKQMPSAYPPTEEQTLIADFLDAHGRLTARLIRNKRRLIGLLNEQKQEIINRAVTRGLNPDTPMTRTGIDWMPEVPAHWDIAALRHRYSVDLGKMLDEKRISGNYLVKYLRNTDVQWDHINTSDLPKMDITEAEYSRFTLLPGDLLVCEGGEVGRSAIWIGSDEVIGFQKALHRARPIHQNSEVPRWLFYLMFAFAKRGVFAADGNENTIAHLTNEKLRAFRFPFPRIKEQQEIVAFIDQEASEIERIKSRIDSEINLILEYRERLIADVVTGKLDVRHIEIAAPEGELDSDEEDTLDEELQGDEADVMETADADE